MTREQIDTAFNRLATLLAMTPLATSTGATRFAEADEFMLMQSKDGVDGFKHRTTRNYVYVTTRPGSLKLTVPSEPAGFFHGGTFDESY
jgi:hypothetical protein